jgi:hypothetical protein
LPKHACHVVAGGALIRDQPRLSAAVRYAGRTDLTDEAIAARIIELAKAGERDPNVLCEAALNAGPVSVPNPLGLPPHRLTSQILYLEPIRRAS